MLPYLMENGRLSTRQRVVAARRAEGRLHQRSCKFPTSPAGPVRSYSCHGMANRTGKRTVPFARLGWFDVMIRRLESRTMDYTFPGRDSLPKLQQSATANKRLCVTSLERQGMILTYSFWPQPSVSATEPQRDEAVGQHYLTRCTNGKKESVSGNKTAEWWENQNKVRKEPWL